MLLPTVVLASGAYAESPEEKGLAIAQEMDRRDRGRRDAILGTSTSYGVPI